MKKLSILILVLAASISGIAVNTASRATANKPTSVNVKPAQQQPLSHKVATNPPGTIVGAVDPAKIPDKVAYLMFFRLIANRESDKEKRSISAYFKQLGVGLGAQTCQTCPQKGLDDSDAEALIAAASEFQQRVADLDKQTGAIKGRHIPDQSPLSQQERDQIMGLQKQREFIVSDIAASLPRRLSADGWAKLQFHINQRVKRNVKIYPS